MEWRAILIIFPLYERGICGSAHSTKRDPRGWIPVSTGIVETRFSRLVRSGRKPGALSRAPWVKQAGRDTGL
jgi:hypothetical protein